MNKLLLTNAYFTTPEGKWSTRAYDLCREWKLKGYEVHVITAKYYKSDLINYEKGTYDFEGVKVHLIDAILDNNDTYLKRIFSFFKFSIFALIKDIKFGNGVRIYSSGPINVIFHPLILNTFFRRRKYNVEIRDLWPEGIEELQILTNRNILKLLEGMVKKVYHQSETIIALSKGMKDFLITKYDLPHTKIIVAPNFINSTIESKNNNLKFQHVLKSKNYLLYFGNFGKVNRVIDLARFFKQFNENFNSFLVFAGNGQNLKELQYFEKNCSKIIVLESVKKQELKSIIQSSLATFVTLKEGLVMDTSSPNKFFESIGEGTPVLQTTNGWIKEEVIINGLGFNIDLDDPNELIDTIKKVEKHNFNREKIKSYAENNYSKRVIALRIIENIK